MLPKPIDNFLVVETDDYMLSNAMDQARSARNPSGSYKEAKLQDKERAEQAKLTAVPARFASEFMETESAANGDAAYQIGKDLPPAIRLYTAAAVDFHIAHPVVIARQQYIAAWQTPPVQGPMDAREVAALGHAIARFQSVLSLPRSEQAPRAVAAAYMLGRCYALRALPGDIPKAEKAFELTRRLTLAGLPDPDGLAVASFGDEARLERAQGNLGAAVHLYAEQAAHESVEGVESLKWVAQALYQDPQGMAKVENLPLAQRVLIAYALQVNDDAQAVNVIYTPGPTAPTWRYSGDLYHPEGIAPILEIAKQWPRTKVAWPARLAALAYRAGDFDFARSLIANQNTALALWLRAKLLVRDGKLAEAETAYRKAVSLIPASGGGQKSLSPFNGAAACYELAQLERARGEFVHSLSDLVACDKKYNGVGLSSIGWGLTSYLAERVLTIKELRNFVDGLPSAHAKNPQEWLYQGDLGMLHQELAQRLVREGRFKIAIRYADATVPVNLSKGDPSFDTGLSKSLKTQRDLIEAYAMAYGQSQHAATHVMRAAARYELALLTRVYYPFIAGHDSPLYSKNAKPLYPGVSRSELNRLAENYRTPDQDNLHWYIAYNDAIKAANLVPARSQAYAAILCHAAHWMYQAPPVGNRKPQEIFKATYQLYLKHGAYVAWGKAFGRHCPDPNFAAAAMPSWRRELGIFRTRARRHPMTSRVVLALLVLALVLAGWFVSMQLKRRPD